jgi:uncharacterized LabA/DUF88 family protein
MKDLDEHKKIAVLIDADNAQQGKVKKILNELSTHGHVVVKRAYGDWSSTYLKNWKSTLNELAVQPVQQFAYTTGKNSTDASMIIDAMDILYTGKFDAFALVSSDSDFTKLAARLREAEVFVFGFGEKKTPVSFRNACDDFVFTENLGEEETEPESQNGAPMIQALIPILLKAWDQYKDDNDWANVSSVGHLIKRQMPDFDPRSYGVTKIPEVIAMLPNNFELSKFKGKGGGNVVAYRPKPGTYIAGSNPKAETAD